MNKNLTEIIFILDRSGSMKPIEDDTIGGYNSFLDRQREEDGEAVVTTVLFDNQYELLHDHIDIREVRPVTRKEYYARGMTALLDAIGKTITEVEHRQNFTCEADTPGKTIVVIITDGMENASREYRLSTVREMIRTQQEKHGWEFIFLGANIDAVKTAGNMGIAADRSVNYHSDSIGTRANFEGVSQAVSSARSTGKIGKVWRKEIDDDFHRRKKEER